MCLVEKRGVEVGAGFKRSFCGWRLLNWRALSGFSVDVYSMKIDAILNGNQFWCPSCGGTGCA